jgi:hypothetical protein
VLRVAGPVGPQCGHAGSCFKLALTRVIEPTGGPGAELATLEDAARFVGLMKPWRQARLHWDFAVTRYNHPKSPAMRKFSRSQPSRQVQVRHRSRHCRATISLAG